MNTLHKPLFFAFAGVSGTACAGDFDAANLSLSWGIPFACILLSIALCPLFLPNFWHRRFGTITLAWTLVFLLPFAWVFGMPATTHLVAHALVEEYIPFILLLLALYTVSGGILIWGSLHGTPKTNVILLAAGTALASIMGTTGAAMLMIRPLLRANEYRKHKVHTVVFFIFLVANIGGGLTPLGDPPLFLGFLKGVDFMWTVRHMLAPVLLSSVLLLTLYYLIDRRFFGRAGEILPHEKEPPAKITVYGKINFLLLAAVVATVLVSGLWRSGVTLEFLGTQITLESLTRDVLFAAIAGISMLVTPKQVRSGNEFDFAPITEVGKLFFGIFITIAPVLAMLQTGEAGPFKSLVSLAHDGAGNPINAVYFWMSGLLSSFLDNAPTYLVFFNMASGDPLYLTGVGADTLLAVSMGSVFMGAVTYIGNAPNFMVKAIAEQRHVPMPTFFGYMAWSVGILIPLFLFHTLIFFI